jgi:hypothetical protein
MATKKDESVKLEKKPTVVLDATPEDDSALCQCTDVVRRWDGDGIAARIDGEPWYVCSECGKRYR